MPSAGSYNTSLMINPTKGQPLFKGSPATFGQSSLASVTPSESESKSASRSEIEIFKLLNIKTSGAFPKTISIVSFPSTIPSSTPVMVTIPVVCPLLIVIADALAV